MHSRGLHASGHYKNDGDEQSENNWYGLVCASGLDGWRAIDSFQALIAWSNSSRKNEEMSCDLTERG